jgi:hypothetical protein
MDKGFNDDELADIMSEIENLEKEFTGDMVPEEEPAAQVVEEPVAEVIEQPVAEVVEEPVEVQAIVEEPMDAVEETLATVEESAPIVEEPTSIVENSVEPTIEPVTETIEEVVAVTEMAPEAELVASTDYVEESPESIDAELGEVLEELSAMPVEETTGETATVFEENVHSLNTHSHSTPKKVAPSTSGGHSSMSFSVEGDMKLDLSFNVSGKIVNLNISENGFELELDGGMKFSIPLDEASSHKKVA